MGQPRLITAQLNRIQCGRRGGLAGALLFLFFFLLFFLPLSFFPCVIPSEGSSVFVWKRPWMERKHEKMKEILRESASRAADGDISANQRLIYNYAAALIQV